jgi:hypothetical protein
MLRDEDGEELIRGVGDEGEWVDVDDEGDGAIRRV